MQYERKTFCKPEDIMQAEEEKLRETRGKEQEVGEKII